MRSLFPEVFIGIFTPIYQATTIFVAEVLCGISFEILIGIFSGFPSGLSPNHLLVDDFFRGSGTIISGVLFGISLGIFAKLSTTSSEFLIDFLHEAVTEMHMRSFQPSTGRFLV